MTAQELIEAYKTGKRDFRGADLGGADLRVTDLRGADLGGADLRGADLGVTNLRGADLRDADLGGADLGGADLGVTNLRGADLGGADLGGADLGKQWVIQGSARSDGYFFHLQKLTDDVTPMIKAGCRCFTVPEAIEHWTRTRGGTPLGDESLAIIAHLVEIARIRGLE